MRATASNHNKKCDDYCRSFGSDNRNGDEGGSAIEMSFFAALLRTFSRGEFKPYSDWGAVYIDQRPCMSFDDVRADFISSGSLMVAYREVVIGKYRADLVFGVQVPVGNGLDTTIQFVVVELDGHDFHEKTKRQAEADKKRDRFMQCQGLIVLRYTGSEVWRSPMSCARGVILDIADSTSRKYETANTRAM